MKTLTLILFLFTFALSANAQNRAGIVGDWHVKVFEDHENGQNYYTNVDFKARVNFSKGGLYRGSRLCNGIGGVYKIEGNTLQFMQSGSFTKINCTGANAAIENAFRAFNQQLTLEEEGSDFYIILPGKFKMLLSRFP
ncbi:MAG TPA: META domain-containing protein [Cytophagales bacterium]|nr:META domain-containing protein [Cytophagales bacterium]